MEDRMRRTLSDMALLLLVLAGATFPRIASAEAVPVRPSGPVLLAGVISTDLTASGKVIVSEDLFIPAGVTLTLAPGASVLIRRSENSLTNPPFLLAGTEILVHGAIRAGKGVFFRPEKAQKAGVWSGIVLAHPGARLSLSGGSVSAADFGVLALAGRAEIRSCEFWGNTVGIGVMPGAAVEESGNSFMANDAATIAWRSRTPLRSPDDQFDGNQDDALALDVPAPVILHRGLTPVLPSSPPLSREYRGEAALAEDTVWSGTVVVDGQVAVLPGATLTVRPGTRVLFRFRDTNGDGMGESWIVVQGRLRVEGSEDAWVLFDAEKPEAEAGAWDSLSLIASDAPDNLVRFAVFRRGVKAFHDHFSKAALESVVFTDNLRGLQFQESEDLAVRGALFRGNKSALRFRDSTVSLSGLVAEKNLSGASFLRSRVTVEDSLFTGNELESLLGRESVVRLSRCAFTGNRQGPRFKGELEAVDLSSCLMDGNLEEGASFQIVKATLRDCRLTGNGLTGLSVTEAAVTVRGSRLAGNGRYEVDNNGTNPVDADGNDWGTGSVPPGEKIYDSADNEAVGAVVTRHPLPRPRLLLFPGLPLPEGDFAGTAMVVGDVTLPKGRTLRLLPGTEVAFAPVPDDSLFDLCSDHPSFPSSEFVAFGDLSALGSTEKPVSFLPQRGAGQEGIRPGLWGAVNLDGGGQKGSFQRCLFTGAETGLHVRDAGLVLVEDCRFEQNVNGLRFSDSPVTARGNTFRENRVGIRFHGKGGLVERNDFYANWTALFATEDFSGVVFRGNAFVGSTEYHVKMGEEAASDLDLRQNTFVVLEGEKTLDDLVFDRKDDPALGRVLLPEKP